LPKNIRKQSSLEYYLPQLFIDTPEWGKIMEMAKEVLKAFNFHKE
jgi:hypothetical protein